MTKEEIVIGNAKIAEIMGLKLERIPNGQLWDGEYEMDWWSIPENAGTDSYWLCAKSKLKYHLSWDWLMPVVEKIESLCKNPQNGWDYCVTIERGYCIISEDGEGCIEESSHENKINAVFEAVVKFIVW